MCVCGCVIMPEHVHLLIGEQPSRFLLLESSHWEQNAVSCIRFKLPRRRHSLPFFGGSFMKRNEVAISLILLLCAGRAPAQRVAQDARGSVSTSAFPNLVRFSGTIAPSSASPATHTLEVIFALYSKEEGGQPLWSEHQTVNLDAGGQYNVFLGAASTNGLPADLFSNGEARWLDVQASGSAEHNRILLTAEAYAFKAYDAETLAGHPASDFVTTQSLHSTLQTPVSQTPSTLPAPATTGSGTTNYLPRWTSSTAQGNSVLYQSGSAIGLGTTGPTAPLEIYKTVNGRATLLKLHNAQTSLNSTADIDFSITSSAQGTMARIGAQRTNYNYNGDTDLVFATQSNSSLQEAMRVTSYGWLGIGIATPHALVEASAPTVTQGFGAYGVTGVGGTATGGGIGGGIGVVGYGGGGTGYFQYADGSGGEFIGGNAAHEGDGIIAIAGSGYAGYFSGDVAASGTFTAGVVSNDVDHPLDPGGALLAHASVGSSEMLNIYTGNATTDAQGEATVKMPAWFEAYNTDFRYQLTAIGQFAQVIIAQKMENNHFRIRSSVPNLEVSWQISAVRNDAYAKANPLRVEQAKEPSQQGFYLHPELYGADQEHQMIWSRKPGEMARIKAQREQQRRQAIAAGQLASTQSAR
jgi:hypothetical protein